MLLALGETQAEIFSGCEIALRVPDFSPVARFATQGGVCVFIKWKVVIGGQAAR
jgi:hypothetical protein